MTNQTLVPENNVTINVIEVKVVNDYVLFKDDDYNIYQLPLLNHSQGISADAREMIMSKLPQEFEVGFQSKLFTKR